MAKDAGEVRGPMMAQAGQKVHARAAAKLRKTFPRMFPIGDEHKELYVVQPKSDAAQGRWCCIDCGTFMQNNLESSMHAPSHRQAWWTGERFEEP